MNNLQCKFTKIYLYYFYIIFLFLQSQCAILYNVLNIIFFDMNAFLTN